MTIRFAVPEDAPALLAIYGEYIDTTITFEYVLPTEAEFAERIRSTREFYPYLVACGADGRPIGYAYAHRAWERAAYGWTAELSIYLTRSAGRQGLGRTLYTMLIRLLRLQGIRSVYGVVTQPNVPSSAFHEKMGFTRTGLMHRAGYKNGVWRDVAWYEKEIAPHDDAPVPVVPVDRLPWAQVEAVLRGE